MSYEPWSSRTPLPRVDELPVGEQGYERDSVQQAFDAFYRHIAQLDATLQTLEAVDAFQRQAGELRGELRTLRSAGWTLQPWRSYGTREVPVRPGIPPALPRYLAELVLIIVLAVFVGVGHFAPWVVIVVMAGGALLVSIVEIVASRERLPARAVAAAEEQVAAAEAAEEAPVARPAVVEPAPEPEPEFGWSAYVSGADDDAGPPALAQVPAVDEEVAAVEPEVEQPVAAEAPPEPEPVVEAAAEEALDVASEQREATAHEEPEPAPEPEPAAELEPAEKVEGTPAALGAEQESAAADAEAVLASVGEDEPEAEVDAPTEEPLAPAFSEAAAAEEEARPTGRRRWFGRAREQAASEVEPAVEAEPEPEPAVEPEPEPEAEPEPEPEQPELVPAAEAGSADEPAGERPEAAVEEEPALPEPEPTGWPSAEAEPGAEPDRAPELEAGDGRRRWFGRRRAADREPRPATPTYDPPSHVRVLPPSEQADDPWERGFDETLEPLGYVEADEDRDEASADDTEEELEPRRLRRRRR